LFLGSPPQRVTLLVDTGSYTTAFPCKGCTTCGDKHTDQYFDPEKSTTFKEVTCDECSFMSGYCENNRCVQSCSYLEQSSWDGYSATDKFYLGAHQNKDLGQESSIKDDFTFVCQTSETGLFH